uniref:Chitin-binding type-2 domain-containing protein n=1 Tax=Biomphalaria glabrata TaxID=6526 RepID=A0A2C9LF25_BIOGL
MAFIQELTVFLTVFLLSQAQQTAQQNRPPQGFNCPQPTGKFEYREDCSKFWQCTNGQATLSDCPSQLMFNPAPGRSDCDWPHNVPNPSCTQLANRGLSQRLANLCQNNPYNGELNHAFHIGSPDLCNAFFICSKNYVHFPCVFCPYGSYFNTGIGRCDDITSTEVIQTCAGRQMIEHDEKVNATFRETCWPDNRFTTLRAPTPTPWRG